MISSKADTVNSSAAFLVLGDRRAIQAKEQIVVPLENSSRKMGSMELDLGVTI